MKGDGPQQAIAGQEKEALYLEVLKALADQYVTDPASTEIQHEIAQFHYRNGLHYQRLVSDTHRWELRKAREACRKAIARYPASDGALRCQHFVAIGQVLNPGCDTIAIVAPAGAQILQHCGLSFG